MSGISISVADDSSVHLGVWTNWSEGKIRGATITLTRRHGDILIAFLALFTTFVGKSFWRISCYALHNSFSSSSPQDGIYHQKQAVLRNASSANDGMIGFAQILWAWRGKAHRSFLRTMPMLLLAVICSTGFGVAGIFSSHIATASQNEVLISSPNCGIVNSSSSRVSLDSYRYNQQPWWTRRSLKAANYASQCYGNSSALGVCNTFVRPKLPKIVERNANCPFQDSLCMNKTGNLMLDSGYLNSNDHFGLNVPEKYRFLYRQLYQCAPLAQKGFAKDESKNGSRETIMRYYYGKKAENITYTFQWSSASFLSLTGPLLDYTIR